MPTSSTAAWAVDLRVLGPLSITRLSDGARVASSPRRAALLAYLTIATPRGPHSRDRLIALLWPDADAERGRRSLRNALHELRAELQSDVIVSVGKHHLRVDHALVRTDLDAFEARLAAGDLLGALADYGDLMDGFHVAGADGFERWHESARGFLRSRLLGAVRRAATAYRTITPTTALALVSGARRIDADDETLLHLEIELHARCGDPTAARRTYQEHLDRVALEDGTGSDARAAAVLTRALARGAAPEDEADALTIALLPFATGDDPSLAEFARALDEGVRRRLTRMRGIHLVAPSVVRAAAHGADPREVGRSVGAELVAGGRIRRLAEGHDLEYQMEVLRVADGTLVREAAKRAPPHELFATEGILAAIIVPPLHHAHAGGAGTNGVPTPQSPRDAECYLLCLRGQWQFLRAAHVGGRAEDLERSREYFEQALALDPGYGAGYAGLSNYYAVLAARGHRQSFEETFAHAIALSHRALELDPSLAVPHVHFGVRALYHEHDWDTARREFSEAVRLDPGYAEAHRFLGIVKRALGEAASGLAALREAVRLDPQIPHFRNSLADALLADGAIDAALTELEIALQLDPNFRGALERLTRCHERRERYADAVRVRERLGESGAASEFAEALRLDGPEGYKAARRRELERTVTRLRARVAEPSPRAPADRFAPPELGLAVALAELGRLDEAWAVERAAAPGLLPWFTSRPELDALAERRRTPPRATAQ